MASRFDVLKSLVRSATQKAGDELSKLGPVAGAREALAEIRNRRASLSEGALGSAVSQAEGAAATTVSVMRGRILVDVTWDDGRNTQVAILPEKARFAPRGAKEVIFRVEPPDAVSDYRVKEVVGCLAAAIARTLWGPFMGERVAAEQALVEREGARLRCDLRSIPSVRALFEGSSLAMAMDVIGIEAFVLEDHALRVKVGLPFSMPAP